MNAKGSFAQVWYKNLDKIIKHVNSLGRGVKAFYSTPQDYVAAKHAYQVKWPLKTDDLFPYADNPHTYWTGYFSSRPTSKAYIRSGTAYLNAARQVRIIYSDNQTKETPGSDSACNVSCLLVTYYVDKMPANGMRF